MSRTPVTVQQYAECYDGGKGPCTAPGAGDLCNWGKPGRELHPVNCVDWGQADAYARFKGARLPSDFEWEYAATGGGHNQRYPWGDAAPTCGDKDGGNGNVVMYGRSGPGCGSGGTMAVCSMPAGNTAQGLCDMEGNVLQWMTDAHEASDAVSPAAPGPFAAAGPARVLRGGSFSTAGLAVLRVDYRYAGDPASRLAGIGFRLARSIR